MAGAVIRAARVVVGAIALVAAAAPGVAGPAPEQAAADAASIDDRIARGKQLFEDQEYADAIALLAPIARDARATRTQRLAALEQIALAQFIRRDRAAARGTFERILDIDPGYDLRDPSGSPELRDFFEQLKRELVPGYDPEAGAELEHAAPRGATAGRSLEIDVRATRGGDRVRDLAVLSRRRGELAYATVVATPRGERQWRARVKPPGSRKGYVLEYYVEARGIVGEAVGRIGSPDAPLEVPVGAGEGERPWYGRWYMIAAAAVVTGVAGAAIVAATRGPADGTLGTVTVTP